MGHDADVTGDPHTPPPGDAPRVALGAGASRDCPPSELAALADATLAEAGLSRSAVAAVASADVKADEPAILALADALGVPTRFFAPAELAVVDVPTPSAVVAWHVGTPSVAEAAALLAAGDEGPAARLLVPKRRSAHATCALATAGAIVPGASGARATTRPGASDGPAAPHGLAAPAAPSTVLPPPAVPEVPPS